MIPVILLKAVEPVTAAKSVAGNRDPSLRLLPQFDPGDILSARVEGKLPDGSFKVTVAGQPLSMALPSYIAPGDMLELGFVAREPRLTFALRDIPQEAPAPLLSAAGRLVAATMLQPGELVMPVGTAMAPLLTAPPADGARLSVALAQTLADSGLFYESHQAEWIAGRRDLAQIRQEPQARLTQSAAPREVGTAAEFAPTTPARLQDQTIDARTVPLVQQQLAAIDYAKAVLQIEIWPGQWMQWEIEEHQSGAKREPQTPPSWRTQLRLDLPRLGEIEAAVTVAGDGVRIRVEAESAASAELLRERRTSLQAALAAAGVPPAGIAIAYHEQH